MIKTCIQLVQPASDRQTVTRQKLQSICRTSHHTQHLLQAPRHHNAKFKVQFGNQLWFNEIQRQDIPQWLHSIWERKNEILTVCEPLAPPSVWMHRPVTFQSPLVLNLLNSWLMDSSAGSDTPRDPELLLAAPAESRGLKNVSAETTGDKGWTNWEV